MSPRPQCGRTSHLGWWHRVTEDLELPNSTCSFSRKVDMLTIGGFILVQLLKKVEFWSCWTLPSFSKLTSLLKWAPFGMICLQYRAFGDPKNGTLRKILVGNNYSLLFWPAKHKLMKYKDLSIKWYSTKKFIPKQIFLAPHSYLKLNVEKVMNTIGLYISLVTCENLTTYWRSHEVSSF